MLTAANAAGQLVFLPNLAELVTHFGWRVMSLVLAATVAVFVPLVALLMRNRPSDLGLTPYGAEGEPNIATPPQGNPLRLAFGALADGAGKRDFLAARRAAILFAAPPPMG